MDPWPLTQAGMYQRELLRALNEEKEIVYWIGVRAKMRC